MTEGERPVVVLFEHGKIRHPKESMDGRVDEMEPLRGFGPDASETGADDLERVGSEEESISCLRSRFFGELVEESILEKLEQRLLGSLGLEEDVCQPLGLQLLCELRPRIDLTTGKLCSAWNA